MMECLRDSLERSMRQDSMRPFFRAGFELHQRQVTCATLRRRILIGSGPRYGALLIQRSRDDIGRRMQVTLVMPANQFAIPSKGTHRIQRCLLPAAHQLRMLL